MATSKNPPAHRPDKDDETVERILALVRESRSFDFGNYKRATLRRRIERRMQERQCARMGDYLDLLGRDRTEFDALIGAMLIKVTRFFRDPEMWDLLSSRVIPQVLADKPAGEELRVWCAGCATGEEAFSVAILLAEAMGPSFFTQDVKVFGTDVDEKAIATARRGLYGADALESVSPEILDRYFTRESSGYCVRKEIRRAVVFGVNNLVSDAPISRLDMLLCRNVFIYLDAQLQRRVLTRFHYALRRHGALVLGKSELIPFAAKIFQPIDLSRRVYRKENGSAPTNGHERALALAELPGPAYVDPLRGAEAKVDQLHRDALQSLRVPLVGALPDGTVNLWNAAAAMLWGRPADKVVGKKLVGLGLPGLSGDVLVEKTAAIRDGRSTEEHGTGTLQRSGEPTLHHLSVDVMPLRDDGGSARGVLYAVQDISPLRALEAQLQKAQEERQNAVEELQTVAEEMQSSNEELETTNEELQSANEELQTTNEELQSTNEELETTNEELQSTNAELDATNRELAHRTEELNALAFVQRTIIRSSSAGVIVLDAAGRVTVWNLAAERLMGVSEEEARGQVLWTLHIPALSRTVLQRLRKAMTQNTTVRGEQIRYELPTGAEGHASITAVPIVDATGMMGSVIIFDDVTRVVTLQAEIARRKGREDRGGAGA